MGFMEDYYKESNERMNTTKEKFLTLITAYPDLEKIVCEYDGSCDSGEIEDPMFMGPNHNTILVSKLLIDTTIDYLYNYLEIRHSGWEINDGSYGHIEIDVLSGVIDITHNERFQQVNTYSNTDIMFEPSSPLSDFSKGV